MTVIAVSHENKFPRLDFILGMIVGAAITLGAVIWSMISTGGN
jgi:hypothetical protein